MEYGRPSVNLLRHPRSFKNGGALWKLQKLSAARKTRVSFGQRLYNVNDAMRAVSRQAART